MDDDMEPWDIIPDSAYEQDNIVQFPGTKPEEVSEDAIALEFTRQNRDALRFDHNAGKWYQWAHTHWAATDVPVAFHFAREIGRQQVYHT